jgi:ribonuclease-3
MKSCPSASPIYGNLEKDIGYSFKNKKLLIRSLQHSSLKYGAFGFEQLEFLGDRVLDLVISEYLYENFQISEGEMAKMQSAFVCADTCYKIGTNINLGDKIQTAGKHLKSNKTVVSDAVEALLGAIFIDGGYEPVRDLILRLWNRIFNDYDSEVVEPKTILQEIAQAQAGEIPVYTVVSTTGPSHEPEFVVQVTAVNETVEATGRSRKVAETNAARLLLQKLRKNKTLKQLKCRVQL